MADFFEVPVWMAGGLERGLMSKEKQTNKLSAHPHLFISKECLRILADAVPVR